MKRYANIHKKLGFSIYLLGIKRDVLPGAVGDASYAYGKLPIFRNPDTGKQWRPNFFNENFYYGGGPDAAAQGYLYSQYMKYKKGEDAEATISIPW